MSEDILKHEDSQVEHLLSINPITPENAVFQETPGGFVALTFNGKIYKHVDIVRTFPLSDADRYISVRDNENFSEIGMIEDLSLFDDITRDILGRQLKLRYFMPKITKIMNIKEEYGYTYWVVMTDKGKCRFASSSGSSGAIIRQKAGVIVKDSNDNRYEIEDLSRLTPSEMKKIDLYL